MLVVSLLALLVMIGSDLKAKLGRSAVKGLSWMAAVAIAILAAGYAISLPFSFEQMAILRSYHLDGKAALEYCRALRDPGVAEAIMAATLYPDVCSLRSFVATLEPIKVFRPAMITDSRMRDNITRRDAKTSRGRLDSITTVDNRYVVTGWAVLPGRNERADGIVLALRNPAQEWIAFTMAGERTDRPDIEKIAADRSIKNIGWKATFPVSVFPANARELSAWAIDAYSSKSYQLEGSQHIPAILGAAD